MKVDFKASLDCHRARQGEFRVLDVPVLQYLMGGRPGADPGR